MRFLAFSVGLALVLAGCGGSPQTSAPVPVRPVSGLPTGSDGYPWWNDTVFYEIFVRSFYDSDGDGIGDLNGLIEKLDYLNDGDPNTATDLGVTGIWLMPIHPATSYHGYDVTDYFAVNPDYGMLDDFKRLLDEAHRRGIRIIIDLVLNHTSSEHPWFVASQDPQSPYRAWYEWSDADPGQRYWHPSASGYYYGYFEDGMPDLNYANPDVTAKMEEVVRFWMQDVGVDGFRLDAAKHLVEEGTVAENSDSTHVWYEQFRPYYKSLDPQAMTVGEIMGSSVAAAQYAEGDELDLAFDFDLAQAIITSLRTSRADQVASTLSRDYALFPPGQFAAFLSNHDQNRVMSQLAAKEDKARLAAMLLLTAPGVPFIYYGEEIGMSGKKPDEDIRVPMQWSSDANAGFTTGSPWRSVNADYADRNVAAQSADPDSLLSLYRDLIGLRDQHAALRVGDVFIATVDRSQPSIYAVLRASQDEVILVVVNPGPSAVSDYPLSLPAGPLAAGARYTVVALMGEGDFADLTANAQGGFDAYQPLPALPARGSFVMQLQPAD